MNLHQLVSDVITNTRDVSLPQFLPELTVCATIVLMLLVRILPFGRYLDAFYLMLMGSIIALVLDQPWGTTLLAERVEIFTGMLVVDGFTVLMRAILLLFAILFALFTKLSGLPDKENGTDIYALVLGATLGMMLMCSSNHLLMVFMSVEMASVPSYALAGMLKGRRQSSEAALKYSVYGAGTAGVMLYGISLIAGVLNSAHLPTLAAQLADRLPTMQSEQLMVLALGGLMIGVGLAFKLSAVPFHFWCPDVFEGATAEVNAFLSVASKAAALALLVRVAVGFGVTGPDTTPVSKMDSSLTRGTALYAVSEQPPGHDQAVHSQGSSSTSPSDRSGPHDRMLALAPVRSFTAKFIAFLAIITCTFGNLAAYGQTNIKRLFAYSTIAHAGYMMMAVPPILAAAGVPGAQDVAAKSAAALGVYIGVYVAMNLGAFAVIAFLRNAMRSEEIADYAGLLRRAPITVICFSIILFSLVGLPPLAGFVGKFAVFAAVANAYEAVTHAGQSGNYLVWLLVVGGINTAISLFYYLRVVKVMTIDPEPRDRPPFVAPIGFLQGCYLCVITLPTVGWIVCWEGLALWCQNATKHLL